MSGDDKSLCIFLQDSVPGILRFLTISASSAYVKSAYSYLFNSIFANHILTMTQPIRTDIEAAWRRGDKVLAIKQLREATNLGLAEAKAMLEDMLDGEHVAVDSASRQQLAPAIEAALARGDKIVAIKLLKDATGIGLKEAKDRVESGDPQQWQASYRETHATQPTAGDGTTPSMACQQPDYEPGRVQGASAGQLVLIGLAIAGLAAAACWYFGLL